MKISGLIEVVQEWALARPLVQRVYLFGSRVRGDVRAASDLDIAVELDPQQLCDEPTAAWVSSFAAWRSELEARIPLSVDLHLYLGDGSPLIKAGLQRSHVLAYQKAGSRPLPWLDSFRKRAPCSRVLVGH